MSYNAIEIEDCFNRIWQNWSNKTMKSAGLKALSVTLRSGADMDLIELACQIYATEHAGSEYHHQLNNFLMNDVWKDVVDGVKNVRQYKEKLELERREAYQLVELWNEKCYSHWCKNLDIDSKVPMARKALRDEFFKNNWKKALDKAHKLFQYKAREGTKHSKLILTFRWFCDTTLYKHTVMRLIEGEYGEPETDLAKRYPSKEPELTEEELILIREENKRLLREVFHDKGSSTADEKDADIGFI